MTSSQHRPRNVHQKSVGLPKACGCSLLTALVSSLVLLPAAAGIAYVQADPARAALPAALISLYTSAGLCGIAAARMSDNPFIAATICGGILLLVTLIFSLFPIGSATCGFSTLLSVITHLAVPAAVMLGAVLGRRRQKHPTTRKKHRR